MKLNEQKLIFFPIYLSIIGIEMMIINLIYKN